MLLLRVNISSIRHHVAHVHSVFQSLLQQNENVLNWLSDPSLQIVRAAGFHPGHNLVYTSKNKEVKSGDRGGQDFEPALSIPSWERFI
jgi:hypothetical protein